jgi:hypothetical protein
MKQDKNKFNSKVHPMTIDELLDTDKMFAISIPMNKFSVFELDEALESAISDLIESMKLTGKMSPAIFYFRELKKITTRAREKNFTSFIIIPLKRYGLYELCGYTYLGLKNLEEFETLSGKVSTSKAIIEKLSHILVEMVLNDEDLRYFQQLFQNLSNN